MGRPMYLSYKVKHPITFVERNIKQSMGEYDNNKSLGEHIGPHLRYVIYLSILHFSST
jgi:hypothetical protein